MAILYRTDSKMSISKSWPVQLGRHWLVVVVLAISVLTTSNLVEAGFLGSTRCDDNTDAWLQLGYGAQHTSYNPCEHVISPANAAMLTEMWSVQTSCTVNQSPAFFSGVLYYGDYCGSFLARNATTGNVVWTATVDTVVQGQSVVDDKIIVAARCTHAECGYMYAFNRSTGKTIWAQKLPTDQPSSPVTVNGVIYLRTSKPSLVAYDLATGNERWNFNLSQQGGGDPSVEGTTLYYSDGRVQARNASRPDQVLWDSETFSDGSSGSQPLVGPEYVYVSAGQGRLLAYLKHGCAPPARNCSYSWMGAAKSVPPEMSPPALAENLVFVYAGKRLHAFNATGCGTGSVSCNSVWRSTSLPCEYAGPQPSIANGVVFLACGTSWIYAFTAVNGSMLWNYHTPANYPMRASPVVAMGTVYHAATFDFAVYAFRPVIPTSRPSRAPTTPHPAYSTKCNKHHSLEKCVGDCVWYGRRIGCRSAKSGLPCPRFRSRKACEGTEQRRQACQWQDGNGDGNEKCTYRA